MVPGSGGRLGRHGASWGATGGTWSAGAGGGKGALGSGVGMHPPFQEAAGTGGGASPPQQVEAGRAECEETHGLWGSSSGVGGGPWARAAGPRGAGAGTASTVDGFQPARQVQLCPDRPWHRRTGGQAGAAEFPSSPSWF